LGKGGKSEKKIIIRKMKIKKTRHDPARTTKRRVIRGRRGEGGEGGGKEERCMWLREERREKSGKKSY